MTALVADHQVREFVEHVAMVAPVFGAPPGGSSEFQRPAGWQQTVRLSDPTRLPTWGEGWAACAVTGGLLAVVDVDPRNKGDVERVAALLSQLGVRVFAEVDTPGGGRHFYVAGHPDLPTCHQLVGWPGVDVQSHGAHVFLPGTRRPKYDTGYTVVVDDLVALADGGDPDGAEALAGWVSAHRAARSLAEPFATSPPWDGAAPGHREAAYLRRVLDNQHAKVAATPPGRRNEAVYVAGLACGNYVAGAGMDEQAVMETLLDACQVNGLIADDGQAAAEAAIRSGLRNGRCRPRAVPPSAPGVTLLADTVPQVDAVSDFWQARDMLAHLHTFARSRRASPWAVLGVALARVVVATEPVVTLPALVGSPASLNLFVAVVAPSGGGKGAAVGAAQDALGVGPVVSCPVGSGEGLTHAFVKRTKEGVEQHTRAVLADVAEVDTLTALSSRQGSTLMSVLRQVYMGEQFGFAYADPTKRLTVAAHSYRLSMVVGVQPARAGGLLDDHDGGTPQRFLWLPATDPQAPDLAPEVPAGRHWQMPKLPPRDLYEGHGRLSLSVCDTARATIDANRVAGLRGEGHPLDGHGLLTRLKVAAALGLLDNRLAVSEEDWQLAGTVMSISDATRAAVVARLADARRTSNRARGDAEAERAVMKQDRVEGHDRQRVMRSIKKHLRRHKGGMSHGDLRKTVASRDRHLFDDALQQLSEEGHITVEAVEPDAQGGGGRGRRYRLSP